LAAKGLSNEVAWLSIHGLNKKEGKERKGSLAAINKHRHGRSSYWITHIISKKLATNSIEAQKVFAILKSQE
jgi:hypothetical protein